MKILRAIRDFFVAVFEVFYCSKRVENKNQESSFDMENAINVAKIIAEHGTCINRGIWCKAHKTNAPEGFLTCPGIFCASHDMAGFAKQFIENNGQS